MKKIACRDGSFTFYNESAQESYHTPLGAAMEAREKYAAPCDLELRAQQGKVVLLDVCYGLGYNTAAALERLWQANESCVVQLYGLEIDPDIVREALSLPFPFAYEELFARLHGQEQDRQFAYADERSDFRVLIGDARERIKEVPLGSVDVVFFDPFSPKKAPELWTVAFMRDVFLRCKEGAVLVTYSCARVVRDHLREAGFLVEDGPVVGRRGPATLGRVAKHS